VLDELKTAIDAYWGKWQTLVGERSDKPFFEGLRPTSVAWKTTDLADFDQRFTDLRDHTDQIHFGWVNERWLVTLYLKDEATLPWNIRVIKLMQRRPGSTDAVGLDHVDFWFDPEKFNAKQVVEKETALKWTEEKNGEHCKWISLWFAGTEAKLRSNTVLQVCADEMLEYQTKLMEGPREG